VAAAKAGSGRSPRLRQTVAVWDAATKAMMASQTESHPGPATRTPAVTTAQATPSRPWGRVLWWTTASGATGLASGTDAVSGTASAAAATACCPAGTGTGTADGAGGADGIGSARGTVRGANANRPIEPPTDGEEPGAAGASGLAVSDGSSGGGGTRRRRRAGRSARSAPATPGTA